MLTHPPAHHPGPDPADPRLARFRLADGHALPLARVSSWAYHWAFPDFSRPRSLSRMDGQPRAPIVLVHGLLGFDRVKVGPYTLLRYFPEIEEALTAVGYRVAVPNLAKTRGVAHRAEQLRRFILDTFPDDRVHVIAHSMGGLDARYMIARLGMEGRVRSLTTVGTPHRGTAVADWGVRRLSRSMKPLFHFWGI